MNEEQLKSAADANIDGSKIPQQVSLEDQLAYLKEELEWRRREEEIWKRETKKEAFRMAINIKPQGNFSSSMGQIVNNDFTTEDLIKSANKIYEELVK